MTLRRDLLAAAYKAQSGHIPSSLSCLDILDVIYRDVLEPGDRFILSKGHAALALYAVLGMLPDFAGGALPGHPEAGEGIEFTTGSLGHGLGYAAGLALGMRIAASGGRVFVVMGDGECQEGSVWEAARIVGRLQLDVVGVVDCNGTHPDRNLGERFKGYHWRTLSIDGHQAGDLLPLRYAFGPLLVLARTVKGRGVREMEADPAAWHHRAPNRGEYERMVEGL